MSRVVILLFCCGLIGHPNALHAKLRQQTVSVEFVEPTAGEDLELVWAIRDRLERQPGVTYQDLLVRIDTHPLQNLELALEQIDDGFAAYERMELRAAAKILEAATRVLSGWPQHRRSAFDGLILLARIYASQGQAAKVAKTLRRALLLKPDYQAPANSPPSLRNGLGAARSGLRSNRGSLRVRTKGRPAVVFLNGRRVGLTPVRLRSLPAGYHHLRLSEDGRRHWYRLVRVSADSTITVRMRKASRLELYRQIRRALPEVILGDGFPSQVSEFKALASSDQAIFLLRLPNEYMVALYDLGRGRLVRRIRIKSMADIDDLADRAVHRLYDGLDPAALIMPRVAGASESPSDGNDLNWLYWGGVVFGVAAAVIIPTLLLTSEDGGEVPGTGLRVRF